MWPWSDDARCVPADGDSRPQRGNIRIRLTRLGWGMVPLCVLLWVLAVNYQVNMAYILVCLLPGILLTGMAVSFRQLSGLSLQAQPQGRLFSGSPARFLLQFSTLRQTPQILWLGLQCADADAEAVWRSLPVSALSENKLTWVLPPQPRGLMRLPDLPCLSVAPFGLVAVECVWTFPDEAVVYPQPIAHDLAETVSSEEGGAVRTDTSGDDPAYLLSHQDGSPLHRVAWKQYAKTGQLLDKVFDRAGNTAAPDILSFRDYPASEGRERIAGKLCYRVLEAERTGMPYLLELPSERIEAGPLQDERSLKALGLW